ncbi:eukaryotic translation initiation factor 2A [Schistocerca piceifrons]|uniref:eukaryotic translation initiation factor 2A n=1 Tax=Schistocerca piceifrons TaxID=274613 RepID=UPI001F5E3732|nr:eukaryotic translation initiation factor 2A [Schistocerca piceifrons]
MVRVKMAANVPVVAVRGSTGISISLGPPSYDLVSSFAREDSKTCRTMAFDPTGKYFAWANGTCVKIASTNTWKVLAEIPRPKVSNITFSPKGTYIMTWEQYMVTPANPQGGPNLYIWKSDTGDLIKEFVQKKLSGWEPQWSQDEKICARIVNNDVLFYENANFNAVANKIHIQKVENFSLAPGTPPYHVLCYCPGKSGQPSFGRLFQYPKFDSNSSLANKSFFQADKVEMMWNKKGNGVLLMTSTEVDKSGSSYYGKQALHFISTKGETAMVLLSKEGPIYSVEWSPKGNEFCVIYGFVPAKATLYNIKCEPVFDFGTGPRNCVHYNPHGNILLLGGFGNLQGYVEIWDTQAKKLITKMSAPDTTLLLWSPDGEHFMTATTAPRLRVGNGFKIWHYTGSLLYERPWNKQEELWEVLWQQFPQGVFKEPPISYKPVEGIQPSQTPASTQVYRPPSARGRESNFRLHEDEPPTNLKPESNPSKAALKQKKKREAKKARKEQDNSQVVTNGESAPVTSHTVKLPPAIAEVEMPDDPEKSKKIKKIKSKLTEISRLKEQRAAGRQLELNQLEKIKKEDELLKELQSLVL